MAILGFKKLEELFRTFGSLDIKKGHAKALTDIIEQKLVDLMIAGERNAKMHNMDVITEENLPITKGLQEAMIEFRALEDEVDAQDVLNYLATVTPLKYPLSVELEAKLPELTGTILLVLARLMRAINQGKREVSHELIAESKEVLDLLL